MLKITVTKTELRLLSGIFSNIKGNDANDISVLISVIIGEMADRLLDMLNTEKYHLRLNKQDRAIFNVVLRAIAPQKWDAHNALTINRLLLGISQFNGKNP